MTNVANVRRAEGRIAFEHSARDVIVESCAVQQAN
jgi:hypothetical protein